MYDKDLRREKRKKWLLYIVAFIIFQSAIIALFTLTIMKVRNPKFRVRPSSFAVQSTATSFNLTGNVQLGIKNTNFGPYKYNNSTVDFYYGNTKVGSATISKSKAQFRRTKKINVPVELASTNLLATDVTNGIVPLTSQSTLTGKVELMLIFKKKKNVNMNCTMEINISTQSLQNIVCK